MICVKGVKIEFIYNKSVGSKLWQRTLAEAAGGWSESGASPNVTFLVLARGGSDLALPPRARCLPEQHHFSET